MVTYKAKINTDNTTNNTSKMKAAYQAKQNGTAPPVNTATVQIKNSNGNFSTVVEGSPTHQNWLKNRPDAIVQPGQMANNTASFSQDNMSGPSGVITDNRELTHSQAFGQNPLHPVNATREGLIQNALKTGDNQPVLNFEAGQAPLHYTQKEDGNYTHTKIGLAKKLESAMTDVRAAKQSGDAAQFQLAESKLMQLAEQVRNAPGIMPYISVFGNGGEVEAEKYGIPKVDAAWWNNGLPSDDVITKGYVGDKFWAENAVFRDNPELLNQALGLSGGYGSQKDQGIRQAINNTATSALGNNSFVNNQLGAEQSMQQGIQNADYDAYIQFLQNQHLRNHFDTTYGSDFLPDFTVNPYTPSPLLNQTQSAIQTLMPQQQAVPQAAPQSSGIDATTLMNFLNTSQTPTQQINPQGNLSLQNTQDDTLNKYLTNIWNGGF